MVAYISKTIRNVFTMMLIEIKNIERMLNILQSETLLNEIEVFTDENPYYYV
jgi:hypothetical protein